MISGNYWAGVANVLTEWRMDVRIIETTPFGVSKVVFSYTHSDLNHGTPSLDISKT